MTESGTNRRFTQADLDSAGMALDTLTAEELHLVEQRFGLNGYKRMKLRELSSIMNISNEAVNKRVKRIVQHIEKICSQETLTGKTVRKALGFIKQ